MIKNFEEITRPLGDDEKILLRIIMNGFKQFDHRSKAVKAPEFTTYINEFLKEQGIKLVLTEPRLRKICNFIRSHSLMPLIATSKGYYVSYDKIEIQAQIQSLEERASAILNTVKGMKQFL